MRRRRGGAAADPSWWRRLTTYVVASVALAASVTGWPSWLSYGAPAAARPAAFAADAEVPVQTSRVGGTGGGMAVCGDRAYVATPYELLVYDLRDRTHPTLAGAVDLPSYGSGVFADCPMLSVGQPGGFQLFDVTDPGRLRPVGDYYPGGSLLGMSMGHVYTTSRNDTSDLELHALDVSAPEAPVARETIRLQSHGSGPTCEIASLHLDVDRLYVARNCAGIGLWRGSLSVLSLPDLGGVSFLATRRDDEYFERVRADGDALYVEAQCAHPSACGDMHDEIIRIDASDPDNLLRGPSFAVDGELVAAEDGFVYVDEGGLSVFDARVPEELTPVGRASLPGRVVRFDKSGANLTLLTYGADRRDVVTLAVDDQTKPGTLATASSPRWAATDMALSGLYAYIATGGTVVPIVDVAWPLHPRQAGRFYAGGPVAGLTVIGNRLYLWDMKRLVVADVSDPLRPRALGEHEMQGVAADGRILSVAGAGAKLYVVQQTTGLAVLDASEPAELVELEMIDWPEPREVIVSGPDVFLRAREHVVLLDLADPHAPRELGRFDVARGDARAMALRDRTVYLGGTSTDPVIRVVDFADPARPAVRGTFEPTWIGKSVAVDNATMLLAGDDALQVIDVSDPGAMRETHFLATRGSGHAVAIRWSDALVADGNAGFVTFTGVIPRPDLAARAWLPCLP